jgi:hypothetical protein
MMERRALLAAIGFVCGALSLLVACPSLSAIGVGPGDASAAGDQASDSGLPQDAFARPDVDGGGAKDVTVDAPCLADVGTDPLNCGRCGHDCLGGQCLSGVCQQTVIYEGDTPSSLSVQGPNLFVTVDTSDPEDGYLFRCSITDCQASKTVLASSLDQPWFSLVADGGVYWVNGGDQDGGSVTQSGSVLSCPGTGCPEAGPIVYAANGVGEDGGADLTGLAIDSTYLYWGETLSFGGATGRISRCAITACASTLEHLAGGFTSIPYALAVDPSYVYWTDLGTSQIERCSLPSCGGNPEIFAGNQASPTGIALYNDTVYWTNGADPGTVLSCPVAGCGTMPTTVASGQHNPYAVVADESGVYWTNIDDGSVMHCPLKGCTKPVLIGSAPAAFAIALDAVSVYFTSSTVAGKVLRVAK